MPTTILKYTILQWSGKWKSDSKFVSGTRSVIAIRNANKYPKIHYSAMVRESGKVIRNPYLEPDQ